MKMLHTLTFNHHITTTTTTKLLSPNLNSPTLNSRFYPRLINPHHTKYRFYPRLITPHHTKPLSPSFSAKHDAVSPLSLKFKLGLGFFLSLSSSPNSPQIPLDSQPSDGNFFNWHKPPVNAAGDGVSPAGKSKVAAVVLGWLGATQKHLRRYAEMYTARGIDAITFVAPVDEVMRFDLGRKVENRIEVLAKEIVSWLSNDVERDRRLVFHTFSTTGWLVYGSILGHMQGRPDLLEKIKGCIFDSGGDPELNPKVWAAGFGTALLKKRNTRVSPLAKAIPGTDNAIDKQKLQEEDPDFREAAVLFVLEIFFNFVFKLPELNKKLSKIISRLSENQPACPQLYLYSTADKVIPYRSVESFIEQQRSRGRDVRSYNFGSSPHVDHYRTFPDAYSSQVNSFINEILATGEQI